MASQICCAGSVFGDRPAIVVSGDGTVIVFPDIWVFQILNVISNRQNELVSHLPFIYQVEGQHICHFPYYESCFLPRVGRLQNLPGGDAVGAGLVRLDLVDGTRLPAPGMVDQQLRVDAKEFI